MALGGRGRSVFRHRDLSQRRRRIASPAFCVCVALARVGFGADVHHSRVIRSSVRLPESSNLGFVSPADPTFPAQRSLLVADRRHVLAKSTPEKFSLPADHDRLCSRGFIFVRAELEAWNGLGAGHSAGSQPNSVSVVLYLDLAACDLATGLRLARSVDHDFRLLFVLG